MPTFSKKQKQFYSTRSEMFTKFRDEQKQPCLCQTEEWAGSTNKLTCYNCIRKTNLNSELEKKGFWTDLKTLRYWKVRRQGQHKELKIAPVYPNRETVEKEGSIF